MTVCEILKPGTPDRGRKRVGGRSARVHGAVLKATIELLTENGVENFSISAASARANVHETSIYRRWGSRQSLILDACLHFSRDAIPIPDTGTLRSDLVALMGRAVAMLRSPQGKVILALTQLRDETSQRALHQYWQRRFERLRPIFDKAVARGEFPESADPIVVLQTLIAPLYFRLLVTSEKLDDWPVAELVDRLLGGYTKIAPSISERRPELAEQSYVTSAGALSQDLPARENPAWRWRHRCAAGCRRRWRHEKRIAAG